MELHDSLLPRIQPGDRIVYMGNYTGHGEYAKETVDELLTFRRMALSIPGMQPRDIVYLRGLQEELWQRLLELQYVQNPAHLLNWMIGNGLGATLTSYGLNIREGLSACNEGIMSLIRWIGRVREAVRRYPGHELFASQQRRAAYTEINLEAPLLFIHAGLDPSRKLEEQDSHLWWAGDQFGQITEAYRPFMKVIRGFDPAHKGMHLNCVTATIDNGCGFGGPLACAGFDNKAALFDLIEV